MNNSRTVIVRRLGTLLVGCALIFGGDSLLLAKSPQSTDPTQPVAIGTNCGSSRPDGAGLDFGRESPVEVSIPDHMIDSLTAYNAVPRTGPPAAGHARGHDRIVGSLYIGNQQWPLDGTGLSQVKVTATAKSAVRGARPPVSVTLARGTNRYDIGGLAAGNYDIEVEIAYAERVSVGNRYVCKNTVGGVSGGADATSLEKRVVVKRSGVRVAGTTTVDVVLPPVVVMVHGIYSSYEKWNSLSAGPERLNFWDNYLQGRGYLTIVPNYYFHKSGFHPWERMASQVRDHVSTMIRAMSSAAGDGGYPPWVYIGHSQGGLVARVLTSSTDLSSEPLVQSLGAIYLLGTPNSGGRGRLFGANAEASLACFSYLGPDEMKGQFNSRYPDYGGKPVLAFAGTYSCGPFWGRAGNPIDCGNNRPSDNDGVVDVASVSSIERTLGTPGVLDTKTFFFNHEQLGSPISRQEILTGVILPDVERSQSNSASVQHGSPVELHFMRYTPTGAAYVFSFPSGWTYHQLAMDACVVYPPRVDSRAAIVRGVEVRSQRWAGIAGPPLDSIFVDFVTYYRRTYLNIKEIPGSRRMTSLDGRDAVTAEFTNTGRVGIVTKLRMTLSVNGTSLVGLLYFAPQSEFNGLAATFVEIEKRFRWGSATR